METGVRKLFERYERVFNATLHSDVDIDDVAGSTPPTSSRLHQPAS